MREHKKMVMAVLLIIVAIVLPAGHKTVSGSIKTGNLADVKLQIEKAYWSEDSVLLRNAAVELEASQSSTTDWHGGYYLGFIYRKLAEIASGGDKNQAKEYLSLAVRNLENSLAIEQSVETYALLAMVNGNRMGVTSLFGRLGVASAASGALGRAVEIDSLNPRVLLVDGISRIYRPGFAGGGYEQSRAKFERALQLWAMWSETDALMLNWGGPEEIYARWAELEIRNKNTVNARRCIEYALELRPEYVFVSGNLMADLRELETRNLK